MTKPVRVGNAQGFWGDRQDAAAQLLAAQPDLDYLTLDYLAEISLSIMAVQRQRDPDAGYAAEFLDVVRALAPYWRDGGACRVITNAGGVNPEGCARRCAEILEQCGCPPLVIGVVAGDDILEAMQRVDAPGHNALGSCGTAFDGDDVSIPLHSCQPKAVAPGDAELLRNLDTGSDVATIRDRLVSANVYLGAEPIVQALASDARIVVTGRVADPSLTVAPCVHHFGWSWTDWNRLAGATIAGHLIECGVQVTGGISTHWLAVPDPANMTFPIVQVDDDGSCVVTRPPGGGIVNEPVVKEQLLYEIGDPDNYLSPDVTVSFRGVQVHQEGPDRVRVSGALGRPAPATYKVSATYRDGYRAQGSLTLFGRDALKKARRAADVVVTRVRQAGHALRHVTVEYLGTGACGPCHIEWPGAPEPREVVLRIAVADPDREAVERFTRELMTLITAGPPGTTGYAEGRPRVHDMVRFWPCLIARHAVQPQVQLLTSAGPSTQAQRQLPTAADIKAVKPATPSSKPDEQNTDPSRCQSLFPVCVGDLACARSGDKGIHANIGVIAYTQTGYVTLCELLTADRVVEYFQGMGTWEVIRYELPNLGALNFVLKGVLSDPLRTDAQGKTLAQALLLMPLHRPRVGGSND